MFAERFSVPTWGTGFAEDVPPGGDVLPVHGVWLMKVWSPAAFEAAVDRLVTAMSPGPDWQTVAARIGRHLPWEFDHKHDDQINVVRACRGSPTPFGTTSTKRVGDVPQPASRAEQHEVPTPTGGG